eukprot:scaffold8422_cov82-Phaeocystis_antarctica.AAC.4
MAVVRPSNSASTAIHPSRPVQAARLVLSSACAARCFAVIAEPALNPNQPNQIMRRPTMHSGRLCACMPRRPRVTVHHVAARKVERAPCHEPAPRAEAPVCDQRVDQDSPHGDPHHEGTQLHAVGHATRDQGGSDARKGHLEGGIGVPGETVQ